MQGNLKKVSQIEMNEERQTYDNPKYDEDVP